MSIIKDTFFGGAEKDAAKTSAKNIQLGIDFQKEQSEIGRKDIRDAIDQARSDLVEGSDLAKQSLTSGQQHFVDQLSSSYDRNRKFLNDNLTQTTDFLAKANQNNKRDISDAELRSLGALSGGRGNAIGFINRGIDGAENDLNPFIQGGQGAFNLQAALSGALGREAQQKAYDDFISSPGQDFLREEQERAILRNASALGGLRGSNVMEELQRRAAGRAALDFDNSFNRLSGLSSAGVNTANSLSQLRASLSGQGAGIEADFGRSSAGIINDASRQRVASRDLNRTLTTNQFNRHTDALSGLEEGYGYNLANSLSGLFGNFADVDQSRALNNANLQQVLGTGLANIATGTGSQVASLYGAKGNALAAGKLGAADAVRGSLNTLLKATGTGGFG